MDSIDYGCYYFPVKEFSAICPICSKVHVFAYQKQMDFKEKGDRYVIVGNKTGICPHFFNMEIEHAKNGIVVNFHVKHESSVEFCS